MAADATLSGALRARVEAEAAHWPRLPLLAGVADGTLDPAVFRHYLEQDYLYLRYYARLFARLAATGPDEDLEHSVRLAHGIFAVELDRHIKNSAAFDCDFSQAVPSAATRAYLDFYDSLAGDRAATLVAMLPCLYGYTVALSAVDPTHVDGPYAEWLRVYASGDYEEMIDRHCAMIDRTAITLDGATDILARGLALEIDFWNQRPATAGAAS